MFAGMLAKYLGGRAIKAVMGGTMLSVGTTVIPAIQQGFVEGWTPVGNEIGGILAQAVGTFIVGHVLVYLPRNKVD